MTKLHPDARATALRHIESLRASMGTQPAPDRYYAEKAAAHVGAKVGDVELWMKGR